MKPYLNLADARIFMSNLKNDRSWNAQTQDPFKYNISTSGGNDRNFTLHHLQCVGTENVMNGHLALYNEPINIHVNTMNLIKRCFISLSVFVLFGLFSVIHVVRYRWETLRIFRNNQDWNTWDTNNSDTKATLQEYSFHPSCNCSRQGLR